MSQSAAALSTLAVGSFFTLNDHQYVLSRYTGSVSTNLVAFDMGKLVIVEIDEDTVVEELDFATTETPIFTLS